MTINDMCCDVCGRFLDGPDAAVRFVYHPGVPELRDDSGLACARCWDTAVQGLGTGPAGRCAACGAAAPPRQSLHLRRYDSPGYWRLCARDGVNFLNSLRTVQPKLELANFRFPGAAPRAST